MLKSVFRNLKSVFIFFTVLILAASIIFILLFYKNYNTQKREITANQNIQKISLTLKQLDKALLNYKNATHPDNFYIYKKDNFSSNVFLYLNYLKNNIETLNKNTTTNDFNISVKLNEIKDLTNEFETNFNLINNNILKIGNSKNGLTENIIQTEQKTNKILKEYPILYSHFRKLKEKKKNLLTIGNEQSEEDFQKEKNNFLKLLKLNQSIFKNISEKQIVTDNTSDWLNTVLKYSKLQQISGTLYNSGLYNDEIIILQNTAKILSEIKKIILTKQKNQNLRFLINKILILLFFTAVFIILSFSVFIFVKKKISTINTQLSELSGNDDINTNNADEFEKTNQIIAYLKDKEQTKIKIVKYLKSEKYSEIKADFNKNDKLGNALIDLKNYLVKKTEERENDKKIKAISDRLKDGIVKFGKIIRRNFGHLDELTFDLLRELVRFLNADIGGFYIINKKENPDLLILKATYAYNEKKIINKEIKMGEGLVGTCAVDKSSVYIDKIDDDYIKIVSGFGHTKPKSLLLTPIFADKEVYGVIELASTGTFTENDIIFIETLSEDIAYTLAYLLSE